MSLYLLLKVQCAGFSGTFGVDSNCNQQNADSDKKDSSEQTPHRCLINLRLGQCKTVTRGVDVQKTLQGRCWRKKGTIYALEGNRKMRGRSTKSTKQVLKRKKIKYQMAEFDGFDLGNNGPSWSGGAQKQGWWPWISVCCGWGGCILYTGDSGTSCRDSGKLCIGKQPAQLLPELGGGLRTLIRHYILQETMEPKN